MTAIALQRKKDIIEQVREGKTLLAIARDLNVTPGAISQYLSKDPEYKLAREIGAQNRLDEQYEAIQHAEDALKLARAREGFRAASWFAEREFPARWGNKQEVTHTASGPLISVVLSTNTAPHNEPKVIEHDNNEQ